MERNEELDLAKLADAFFDNLEIDNCEFGGIGLDSKRPFGNSCVEVDMLEIIEWEPEYYDEYEACYYYSDEQKEYVYNLYHEKLIPYLRKMWKK